MEAGILLLGCELVIFGEVGVRGSIFVQLHQHFVNGPAPTNAAKFSVTLRKLGSEHLGKHG